VELFPEAKRTLFDPFMAQLHYDPSNASTETATPVGIGNTVCNAFRSFRRHDGSNQLGDMTKSGRPYADYTDYASVNPRSSLPIDLATVKDSNRFQALSYKSASTRATFPEPFLGAHWFKVVAFAGPYDDVNALVTSQFPPAQYGSEAYEM